MSKPEKLVRIFDEAGRQVGMMSLREAIAFAKSKTAELIRITEKSSPPVYRMVNSAELRRIDQQRKNN
jgi:translation initiation factor IF-3